MSEPTINEMGDVISSNLNSQHAYADADQLRYQNYMLLPGQIQTIYAVDDSDNDPGFIGVHTVYDVLVYNANGATELVRRCVMLQPGFGGSLNNYMEVLPANPGPLAKDGTLPRFQLPGSYVLVAFMNGHRQNGVILGALPHPNPIAVADRPKKTLGTHLEAEFQGLNIQVTNDGGFKLTFNGPKSDLGTPLIPVLGPTTIEIDKTGSVNLSTNLGQSIQVDAVMGIIEIKNGTTEVKMDQKTSTVTTNSAFLTANVTAEAKIKATGTATVSASGPVTVSSDSVIKLQRGEAGLAIEPFVLGTSFKVFMTQLLTTISTMTFITTAPGTPTTPSVNSPAFLAMIAQLDTFLSTLILGSR